MRLLIITQKIDLNDDVLGFTHGWVEEFSRNCRTVTVICLQKGLTELPGNIKVLSLGKETGKSRLKYLANFYKHIWQERKNYDKVLVHMNPEYVILGGLLWRIWGKKVALWYTHKMVYNRLWLAEKLADIIFTASAESFRLKSQKVQIMGHGIDTDKFTPAPEPVKEKIILNIDRISPTKNQLEIIKMFSDINKEMPDCRLVLAGAPVYPGDEKYGEKLKDFVKKNNLSGRVKFLGAVANRKTPAIYRQARVFVNFSSTGSLDKNVLEAMACNLPAVTTNEAFKGILPPENYARDFKDAEGKVAYFLEHDRAVDYRETVVQGHSLNGLISKIVKKLE